MDQSNQDFTDKLTNPPAKFDGGSTLLISHSGSEKVFLTGDIVGGAYQLVRQIGHGGMGVVFACHHEGLQKDYAIKILSSDRLSEESWNRFRSEAQVLAKLNHPGIVSVYNMGLDGGQFPYYVMDLLNGFSLDVLIGQKRRLSARQALDIFIQVADALATAHGQFVIHRDIKPSNIMLVSDATVLDNVRLVDFGIARWVKEDASSQSQTKTGMVFGTPYYMSPEQCEGARTDARTDIYSLGCALFETLTGRVPFSGENSFQTMFMHQTEEPPRLKAASGGMDFPAGMQAAVNQMLAKNPDHRYQNMTQVKNDLERVRQTAQKKYAPPVVAAGSFAPRPISAEQLKVDPQPEIIDKPKSFSSMSLTALLVVLGLAVIAGASYALYMIFAHNPDVLSKKSTSFTDNFRDLGQYNKMEAEQDRIFVRINAYIKDSATAKSSLRRENPPVFAFPSNVIIGALRFENDKPIFAYGNIPLAFSKHICLYLNCRVRDWPDFLAKVGPYDLNGLELTTKSPGKVLDYVKNWKSLDELCFFNSLLKALPDQQVGVDRRQDNEAYTDESPVKRKHLERLDQMTNLKTLGLCGVQISGGDIARMKLLTTINTLKLKRVPDLQPLLKILPQCDNIKELWLVGEDITDQQVGILATMKNLETLRIRRSAITPASLALFKKMPALKHLTLDKVWPEDVSKQFENSGLGYQYEPLTDGTYWVNLPEDIAHWNDRQ